MADPTTIPMPRRPDLLLRPLGDKGTYVVKDPRTGAYYNLGEVEAFLLQQLDGRQTAGMICAAFQERFGDSLSIEELDEFLEMARSQEFLQTSLTPSAADVQTAPVHAHEPTYLNQSILYWRRSFFDPDALLNIMTPRLSFLWTRGFFLLSMCLIAAAGWILVQNRHEAVTYLPRSLSWETVVLAWIVLFLVTTCHEFAHGLTCKHHGGEVHEIGFLMIFFMPCFYCNVSDAWLIPHKWKRLWVTLAGGYCDLCVWALAVFVWRLTPADAYVSSGPGMVHHLAWVTFTVCGTRVFLNFNPFLKLDGYYLLADWLEITNLRQRSWDYLTAHLRRLLWGAPAPAAEDRPVVLLVYGLSTWLFSLMYLSLLVVSLTALFGRYAGVPGAVAGGLFGLYLMRSMVSGITGGELMKMIFTRWKRTALWVCILVAGVVALIVIPMEDRASGSFQVRPVARTELRAPISGFLATVHCDEGDHVTPSMAVAGIDVPDLASKTSQKRAEVQEVMAKLRLLEAGPRREEIEQQRQRLERARRWAEQGRSDLTKAQEALKQDLVRLSQQISQCESELEFARYAYQRDEKLFKDGILSQEQYAEKKRTFDVAEAQLAQARAHRLVRESQGTTDAECELGRREKEAAEARAILTLLETPARSEELDAERSRLARLEEELHYLEGVRQKVVLTSPLTGIVTTPRLKEKVGHYLKEGDLICTLEDPSQLEVEVIMEEQAAARVHPGQTVELKVRALPFRTFRAIVTRVAATAVKEKEREHSTVTVCCRLEEQSEVLRTGMTGNARIQCGSRSSGSILLDRAFRYLRTEFWW